MKQIKVIHTKMHKIPQFNRRGEQDMVSNIPVAEAKLVLVECKPEEALLVKPQEHWMLASFALTTNGYPSLWIKYPRGIFWKPILISETEKIEIGDKALCDGRDNINQAPKYTIETIERIENDWIFTKEQPDIGQNPDWTKKILALPEHFSPKHLQAIVDGKMKDGDKVLVECEQKEIDCPDGIEGCEVFHFNHIIKLNSSNHITFHKIDIKYDWESFKLGFEAGFIKADGGPLIPDKLAANAWNKLTLT